MRIKLIALTSKSEEALRKYIQASIDKELEMSKLSRTNPKRIKFEIEQKMVKKFVDEEFFENPLMIVATLKPKIKGIRILEHKITIEHEFEKIMLNSNCGKEDYKIELEE